MSTPDKIAALHQIRDDHAGQSGASQCTRMRAALARFPVTTFEAMRYLDVYDPRARVMQLRNRGDNITTVWQTVTTESGDTHRVGLYVLDTVGAEHDHA
ncbi:MAG: helix-turn-helix domain-containing protein [Rhodoferax sp.]|uniref:helix-turn-helix domain-containing protein n=1 Tax=Rhodoferax sp. TaxID=50421 RepID=UPI003267BA80